MWLDLPNTSSIGPTDDLASNPGVGLAGFTQYIVYRPIDDLASNPGVSEFTQYIVYRSNRRFVEQFWGGLAGFTQYIVYRSNRRFGEQSWRALAGFTQYVVYFRGIVSGFSFLRARDCQNICQVNVLLAFFLVCKICLCLAGCTEERRLLWLLQGD